MTPPNVKPRCGWLTRMTVNTEYPEPDQKRACMRCIWWLERNRVVGQCRRMPPARPDGEAAGFWPMTGRADWCGEYREGDPA